MMSATRTIVVEGVAAPPYQFTNGLVVEGSTFLFLSGQLALDPDGALVGGDDFRTQARQVFHNIATLLQGAGASLSDVVKFTIYLVRQEDGPAFREVRSDVFVDAFSNGQPLPTSTMVFVSGLVSPEFLIEIEATAVLDTPS